MLSSFPDYLNIYLKVSISLSEFHKWVKDVVRSACEEALVIEGFVPDPVSTEREGIVIIMLITNWTQLYAC